MKITPIRKTGGSRTGTLEASYQEIVDVVGKPNVTDMDDPDKVKASWGFQDDTGRKGFIWCYHYYGDVKKCNSWSTDGDTNLMTELFGNKFEGDRW